MQCWRDVSYMESSQQNKQGQLIVGIPSGPRQHGGWIVCPGSLLGSPVNKAFRKTRGLLTCYLNTSKLFSPMDSIMRFSLFFHHLFVSSSPGSAIQCVFTTKWPSRATAGLMAHRCLKIHERQCDVQDSLLLQGAGREDKR